MSTVPRSLVWATHIDVLGVDGVVERRDDHLVDSLAEQSELLLGEPAPVRRAAGAWAMASGGRASSPTRSPTTRVCGT